MMVGSPLTNEDWDTINDCEDYRISFPKWDKVDFSHVMKPKDSEEY